MYVWLVQLPSYTTAIIGLNIKCLTMSLNHMQSLSTSLLQLYDGSRTGSDFNFSNDREKALLNEQCSCLLRNTASDIYSLISNIQAVDEN